MEKPWFPQRNRKDAPIALIKGFIFHLNLPISQLTIEKDITAHKEFPLLSFTGLKEILQNWGITTIDYEVKPEQLTQLPPLSILFINEQEDDVKLGVFVMLFGIENGIVEYLHPRKGWVLEDINEFKTKWANAGLSITGIERPEGEKDFEEKEQEYNKLKYENPDLRNNVRVLDNFLSDEECDHIIKLAEPIFKQSGLMADENIIGYGRTSYSAEFHVYPDDPVLLAIRKKASEYLKLPESHFENFQCVSYTQNQEYQNHFDTFDENSERGKKEIEQNGQRKYTMLAYLNDDFDGGATFFPHLDFLMRPKKGRVLIFNNLDENGKVIKAAFHAGLPVTKGRKYAANIWVREKPILFETQ